jgi:hypothetical protein
MAGARKPERPVPDSESAERAQKPGGNPDRKPSANAGNVGLGAADEGEAPRKPGSAR